MACILVERGLPFLLTGCQGRLPAAWVNYDIQTSWVGEGLSKKAQKVQGNTGKHIQRRN